MKNAAAIDSYSKKDKKQKEYTNLKKSSNTDYRMTIEELDKPVSKYYSWWSTYMEAARNMRRFIYIDQWEYEVRTQRTNRKKPVMTFNKIIPILNGMLGEFRNNTPAIAVRAADEKTTQQQVDIINGYFRYINYKSEGNVVYQELFRSMLEVGWGAYIINIEYEHENTFNKWPTIKYLHDDNAVFFDRTAQLPDKSDGSLCGYYECVSKDDFIKCYPDIDDPQSAGTYYWARSSEIDKDCITICHQWCKHYYKTVWCKLSDGQEMNENDANEYIEKLNMQIKQAMMMEQQQGFNPFYNIPIPVTIVEKKEIMDYELYYYQYIKNSILQCKKWPGKKLPIIFSMGIYTFLNGDFRPISYFETARDAQKLTNYALSETAHCMVTSRREQFIGTREHVKGVEEIWENSQFAQGLLPYTPDPNPNVPPPQKIVGDSFDQAILQAAQMFDQQTAQCLGRYDENRGNESNAVSGIAISNRQTAGNLPLNMIEDNVKRAIKQGAEVLLELIPYVLSDERKISTLDKKGNQNIVNINKKIGYSMDSDGNIIQMIENDMRSGKYDVEVRVDDTYENQQLEVFNTLATLSQNNPQIGMLSADLLIKYSGLPCAPELEERLKNAQQQSQQQSHQDPRVMIEQQRIQLEQQQLQFDQQKAQMQYDIDMKKLGVEHNKTVEQSAQHTTEAISKHINDQQKINIEKYKADNDLKKAHLNAITKISNDINKSKTKHKEK